MYKKESAVILATIMFTALFASLSAAAAGSHASSSVWKDTGTTELTVAGDTSMVVWATVTNDGPDPVDNVQIVATDAAWGPRPTIKVFEDNIVRLENSSENVVLLPKGTLVELNADGVHVLENTPVIIPNGAMLRIRPQGTLGGDNVDAQIAENLSAKVINKKYAPDNGYLADVDNLSFVVTDNANTTEDRLSITVDNGTVRLLADTQVVRLAGNVIRFPSDTQVELVTDITANAPENGLTADNVVTLENDKTVSSYDTFDETTENDNARIFRATEQVAAGSYQVYSGDNVLVHDGYDVVFSAGTEVILNSDTQVSLAENTDVIRVTDENARMISATATDAENQPNNWMQSQGATHPTIGEPYVEWVGIADNQIASGDSLDFPFALTSPTAGGDYTVYVRTTDTNGVTKQSEITLTVDNTAPTVTISASPEWASGNENVTITVTASEKLAKLDNVMVAENNAPENTQVTMSSDDNITWTGTYTTVDNTDRDGVATIYVIGADFEDLVGNTGTDNTATFNVDRVAPLTPKLDQISDWPTNETGPATPIVTNDGEYFLENRASDNFADSIVDMASGTVKIRVGATEDTESTATNGYWSYDLALTEGVNEVGVTFVDRAGNESTENVENITYDATAPSVSLDKISGVDYSDDMYITDNTPIFELTISDSVVGVENARYDSSDNSGFTVTLENSDGTPIDNLVNALAWDRNTLSFENTYSAGLDDGLSYRLYVVAGDNLQMDNAVYTFTVDVTSPSDINRYLKRSLVTVTEADGTGIIESGGATSTGITDKSTLTVRGTSVESGSTIKIYVKENSPTYTEVGSTTLPEDEDEWETTISLSEGTNELYLEETDLAGNVSDKVLFAMITVDLTAPTISLSSDTAALDGTSTGDSSVTVSATITDTVADYKDMDVAVRATAYDRPETPVTLSADNTITWSVPLQEGSNTIDIVAQDSVGNTSIESITVTRSVTPWTMYAVIGAIIAIILAAIAIIRRSS